MSASVQCQTALYYKLQCTDYIYHKTLHGECLEDDGAGQDETLLHEV